MQRLCLLFVAGTLLAGGVLVPRPAGADEPACSLVKIGLEPSQAGNSSGSYLGRSTGQSFLASDTLIQSLTVWRVASQGHSQIGMHLYIVEMSDTAGYHSIDRVILDGPTVLNLGDGVNPTPFTWHFDPPFALPHPGTYTFFLAQDPCAAYFDVITTAEDAGLYPDGIHYLSGRTGGCNMSSGWADAFPRADLIFQIVFCSDAATGAKPETWGRLKTRYR